MLTCSVSAPPAPAQLCASRRSRRASCAPHAALTCRAEVGSAAGADQGVALGAAPLQRRGLLLAGVAAVLLPAQRARAVTVAANPEPLGDGLVRFYGRATSSSSYGGYGGSDTNYRYSFILPDSWKSDTVSKVDKATNGTDVRYSDPSSKGTRTWVTSFNGYPTLKEDRRSLINDLALSDSALQDALSYADAVDVVERTEDGQLYIDFDILSGGSTTFATVTTDGARLYALFCLGASSKTDDLFRNTMRPSLRTIKTVASAPAAAQESSE